MSGTVKAHASLDCCHRVFCDECAGKHFGAEASKTACRERLNYLEHELKLRTGLINDMAERRGMKALTDRIAALTRENAELKALNINDFLGVSQQNQRLREACEALINDSVSAEFGQERVISVAVFNRLKSAIDGRTT